MVRSMKRFAVLLVQLLILVPLAFPNYGVVSSGAAETTHIVINEFDSNPPSGSQWVELFNPTDLQYDISFWKITTQSVEEGRERETGRETQELGVSANSAEAYTLPGGASIAPRGYFVVDLPEAIILPSGDTVILLDRFRTEIDRTPSLSKPVKDDKAWARVPNGVDTNSMLDWKLQPATKGASNTPPAPPPPTPTILCTLSSPQVEVGSSVTVRVLIDPPRSAPVTIQVRRTGDLDWNNLTTTLTEASGIYTYAWTPDAVGEYNVRAYVYPSDSFPGLYSLPINLLVTKIRTQISCVVTRSRIRLGMDLATYGYIIPALEGANVTLTYRKPTGAPIVRYILTASGGLYNDTIFTPQEVGSWNVTASWEGDETHTSASSPLTRFNVEQPPSPPFGMWIIISLVVSVAVAAILLAAGLSTTVVPKPPRRVALCPQCGSILLYVPHIRGWYCPRCKRHI